MKGKYPSWPRPSTRAFFREGWHTPGYSFFDWLHGYVYGRWPYLYIGVGTGEHRLARFLAPLGEKLLRLLMHRPAGAGPISLSPSPASGDGAAFADTYHGKVVPLEAATHLVMVQEEVNLTNLEQIIPYGRARDIILRNPDHIVALECPCRSVRPNPCLPLDVCLIIGEPFASFVAEHHPRRSRWLSQGEAVEILRAEHERGHVHHAFFKDAMLGRFYAICNCCACCCGAMQAWRHGVPMLAASGYRSQVDTDVCIGCGDCSNLCQFGALSADGGIAIVDAALCMGCGVCVSHCTQGALSLVRDPGKGEPLEIRELLASVDDRGLAP
jgi:ferredoxin